MRTPVHPRSAGDIRWRLAPVPVPLLHSLNGYGSPGHRGWQPAPFCGSCLGWAWMSCKRHFPAGKIEIVSVSLAVSWIPAVFRLAFGPSI